MDDSSISSDYNAAIWKAFIHDNGMTWPQYRDADHGLSNQFSVGNIPHYVLIDSNGVIAPIEVGSMTYLKNIAEAEIRKLIAKAAQATALAMLHPPPPSIPAP